MRFLLDGLEVFFPYDYVYKEQYQYMLELKRSLDAKGDAILEMPTGTGKTVSLLALITSYQFAHPEAGKLIYCTRTVPEMTKAVDELKRVIEYRTAELSKGGAKAPDMLAVCLSSRRNMCVHPDVIDESDREKVDAACRSMTASWVRQRAKDGVAGARLCDFFERFDSEGADAGLTGIYNLDDIKALGTEKGWCPYFLTRHVISYANVVVYNYQYMLDPKIAALVSRELEDKSIVVFDEAHNIDNVCIEALSVSLDRRTIDGAARNLGTLGSEVKRMKQEDAARLQDEYARMVHSLAGVGGGGSSSSSSAGAGAGAGAGAAAGLGDAEYGGGAGAGAGAGGEELPGPPVLPSDVLAEHIPGNIRNAELFVRFMKHVVRYLREKIKVGAVLSEAPSRFLHDMSAALAIDVKPLRFAYTRLNSLLRTLQVTDVDDFTPLQLVADFATLLATYPVGFMVITEPYSARTPHIPDPVMQLCCLDASLAVKPVFAKFQSVILTSGTLSPLDMYPKMLNFNPVVRVSLEMSIVRPCICPMVVSRGGDQTPMTTKFELRDDKAVVRNYGMLLVQMCATVPDGVVAFFPSYGYMETIIAAWHEMGILSLVEAHKLLFIETKDIVETTLSLNNYKRACDLGRGAVFLSVARGKVAEGIDFDRHYGRCVVLFGIPFQYTLSHVLRARLVYLRDTFGIREQDFLTFDALRQSSQCIGRVIRSKRDYGIIVFADKRYASADKRSKLPQWVLQFMPDAHINLSTDMSVHLARRFLKEMAQPLPEGADRGKTLLTKEDLDALVAAAGQGAAPPGGASAFSVGPLGMYVGGALSARPVGPAGAGAAAGAGGSGGGVVPRAAASSGAGFSTAAGASSGAASGGAGPLGDAAAQEAELAAAMEMSVEELRAITDAGVAEMRRGERRAAAGSSSGVAAGAGAGAAAAASAAPAEMAGPGFLLNITGTGRNPTTGADAGDDVAVGSKRRRPDDTDADGR